MRHRDLGLGVVGLGVLGVVVVVLLGRVALNRLDHGDRRVAAPIRGYTVSDGHLYVDVEGSPCDVADVSVAEKADGIVVTAYVTASDVMCVQVATGHRVEVPLSSPWASRSVFDGACIKRSDVPRDPSCLVRQR